MRSRLRLFKLEIKQACYFHSPATLLKLMYWHVLSPHLILPVKTRVILKSHNEVCKQTVFRNVKRDNGLDSRKVYKKGEHTPVLWSGRHCVHAHNNASPGLWSFQASLAWLQRTSNAEVVLKPFKGQLWFKKAEESFSGTFIGEGVDPKM